MAAVRPVRRIADERDNDADDRDEAARARDLSAQDRDDGAAARDRAASDRDDTARAPAWLADASADGAESALGSGAHLHSPHAV
jgi:hypothetical protein